MLLRVRLLSLVPKEDAVGNHQCRFKDAMIKKRGVPPRVVHDGVQYLHKIKSIGVKYKMLLNVKRMRILLLTETTMMMIDSQRWFQNRAMEAVRAMCSYCMIIISIGQFSIYGVHCKFVSCWSHYPELSPSL
jgi:hypothetical protein